MNDNFAIDQLVEQIAATGKIKSFYPISISRSLNLPINVVLKRLNYLVDGGLLKLKYEIRCSEHLIELGIVDSYEKVLGQYMNCYECNEDVLIGLENIFIVYFLNDDYIESVKKKKSLDIGNMHNKIQNINFNDAPQDLITIIGESIGQNEVNTLKNIANIDKNIGMIADVLSNSGDKDIANSFKEIDGEIESNKRKKIGEKLLDGAENLGKLKDGAEALEKFGPMIITTVNVAIDKWPIIQMYIDNFKNYITSLM